MRALHCAATALVLTITACAGGVNLVSIGDARPQAPLVVPMPSLARASGAMPVHCPAAVPYMPVVRAGKDVDRFMPRGSLAPSPCRDAEAELRMAVLQPGGSVAIMKPARLRKMRTGGAPR